LSWIQRTLLQPSWMSWTTSIDMFSLSFFHFSWVYVFPICLIDYVWFAGPWSTTMSRTISLPSCSAFGFLER
jgi:hypothetical protein